MCAACHGANGVSVADNIPNLAGQRVRLPRGAAARAEVRRAQERGDGCDRGAAGNDDIVNVAAYFGSLQPAHAAEKSAPLPALVKTNVTFPEDYKSTFTMYQTVNRPDINQVRYLWANPVALQAARDGKPLPRRRGARRSSSMRPSSTPSKPVTGGDGFFVSDRFLAFAVMGTRRRLGQGHPRDAAQRRLELRRLHART